MDIKKREKGSDKKEEAMSREGAALIILIVLCRVLPRTAAHTHLSQLGVVDFADTETELVCEEETDV